MMRILHVRVPLERSVLDAAAACVRAGGTLVFPTDTVYGIGCDPENARAVEAVFAAKGRPQDKPLAVHLAQPSQAGSFGILTPQASVAMELFWPGPVAIVVDRIAGVADTAARGRRTISLRCPSYEPCTDILRAAGPLAASSANISGEPPFDGAPEQALRLTQATLAIVTGPTPAGRESTVLDCSVAPVKILREGAVGRREIASALESAGVRVA